MLVTSITPLSGTTGVALLSPVIVTFDAEVDPLSVNSGTLVVTGPDTNIWAGPALSWRSLPYPDLTNDILTSPGYKGFVPGTIVIETIEGSGSSGGASCSRATFTPTHPLFPETSYKVIVVGGAPPTDDFQVITTKTVGTPVASVIGTGRVSVYGSWDSTDDFLHILIVDDGDRGEASFSYYYETTPATIYGPVTVVGEYVIGDLKIYFTNASYVSGDHFRIPLYEPEILDQFYSSTFVSSESVEEIPEEESVPITGPFIPIAETFAPYVVNGLTSPQQGAIQVDTGTSEIIVEFSMPLDGDTVTADTVTVWEENLATLVRTKIPIAVSVINDVDHGRIVIDL